MANQSCFTLGSASPRRRDLLAAAGLYFDIETVDIDEAALVDLSPSDPAAVVDRIARAKFAAFPIRSSAPVLLTADTLVACDDTILGKPDSVQHLRDMLAQMSGRSLDIVTAVCVGHRGKAPQTSIVSTTVVLRELPAHEVDQYVATGAGMDKAGGLALQAQAKRFISSVSGCWSNVLGLPVCAATMLLALVEDPTEVSTGPAPCSVGLCGSRDR